MKKNKIYIFLSFFSILITNFFAQNAYANFISAGDQLTTSNYVIRAFDVSDQLSHPRDVTFNNDGTKMFTVDNGTRKVFEYTLSTPYNISTAVFVSEFSVSSEDLKPMKVKFNNDGSKMFIGGREKKKYLNIRSLQISIYHQHHILKILLMFHRKLGVTHYLV